MRYFWAILALGICAGGIMYIMDKNARELRKEAELREEKRQAAEERRLEQERMEAEKTRAARAEALAREDAVHMLQKYVSLEEERLKEKAEELKLQLQRINIDKERFSDEMALLEKEEANKAENARRRGVERRAYTERVEAMLKSTVFNSLASIYLGEDFSSAMHKFRSEIGGIVKREEVAKARLEANRREWQNSQEETEKELARLANDAVRELKEARGRLEGASSVQKKRLADLRKAYDDFQRKIKNRTPTKSEMEKLERLQELLAAAEAHVNASEATEGLGAANATHLRLTQAETAARRRGDIALSVRQDKDNDVLRESTFEESLFAKVALYEMATIDKLRDAMMSAENNLASRLDEVESKLKKLGSAIASIDMQDAKQIESLRKKIADSLSAGLLEEERNLQMPPKDVSQGERGKDRKKRKKRKEERR